MFDTEIKYKDIIVISIGILFTLINSYLLYFYGFIYLSYLPVALLLGYILIVSYDKIFFLIAFFTPLSLNLSYFIPEIQFNLSILTEPLLILILIILVFKILVYNKVNVLFLKHPITISLFFYLFWILISSITSSIPLVSFKFLLSKVWLSVPVFFLGIKLFKKNKNIRIFIWAYSISLFFIFIYSTIRLGTSSMLSKNAAHFVVKPFYNDHTAYGTILALFTPVLWGLYINYKPKTIQKIVSLIFAISFTVGIVLSYSRASWLGTMLVIGILILIKFRIKFKYILFVSIIFSALLYSFWFQIIDILEKNKQDSSSNITNHIYSITNISTDASNVERLNRWYCAVEMFKEKPIVGWGPGTYQFQYAPFQLKRMRTIISTNTGNIGNAHSEYLGALAEQGLFGLISFVLLGISIFTTGFRVFKQSNQRKVKTLALSISLAFVTYFFHAFLNNFLDTDKITIPFFGFAAILVALDIYHKEDIKNV